MSFVTMGTSLPSCFLIEYLEQLLKFLVNFTLLKQVKSQRIYGFFNNRRADFLATKFWSLLSLLKEKLCIALYCIVLYCIVLYCIVLYCIVL